MNESKSDYEKLRRFDVTFVPFRKENGDCGIEVVFDPVRYNIREYKGEMLLIDKLEDWGMPLAEVNQLITEGLNRGEWNSSQQALGIGAARAYIQSRRELIRSRLQAMKTTPYALVDRSEELLAALPNGIHDCAVISVDLVGSTRLANALDPVAYARVIGVILEELAAAVPYFHAHILKFTGDGVLAYLPPPSFNGANDNAIDCALTIRGLVRDAINPVFEEMGYPTVDVRIGIESGGAVALTVGHSSSKQQRDLIGQVLNIACKIQASGLPGEIRIGLIAYRNMHTRWKIRCEAATLPEKWTYTLGDGTPYPIFRYVAGGVHPLVADASKDR